MLPLCKLLALILCLCLINYPEVSIGQQFDEKNIPLPEHPRPDFYRSNWVNLNGPWDFKFDNENNAKEAVNDIKKDLGSDSNVSLVDIIHKKEYIEFSAKMDIEDWEWFW